MLKRYLEITLEQIWLPRVLVTAVRLVQIKNDDNRWLCILPSRNPAKAYWHSDLSPLGSSNLATLKSKQIKEVSIPINWSTYIENTYKPRIFHKDMLWFSSNSKKIHHYLLLTETQKDDPHPIWKQLQKAAHCQENMILDVKEEPQAVESKWVNLRVYLFSI